MNPSRRSRQLASAALSGITSVLLAWASTAHASNSQTTCGTPVGGFASCTVDVGHATMTTQSAWLDSPQPIAYNNVVLPLVDVVQTPSGAGIAFDIGYSGQAYPEGPSYPGGASGSLSLGDLHVAAKPGYVLDSVTLRVEGTVTNVGDGWLKLAPGDAGSTTLYQGAGTHALNWSSTFTGAQLSALQNTPAMQWSGGAGGYVLQPGGGYVFNDMHFLVSQVILTAAVSPAPEPSTAVLLALGLMGLAGVRRSRR